MPVVLMLAMVTLLLLQAPPVTASVSVVVAPAQTVVVPVMVPAVGDAVTVIVAVA